MKSFKVLFVAVAATFAVSFTAQANDEVVNTYNKAAELVGAKNFAGAIPLFEQVIAKGLDAGPEMLENVQNAQKMLPTCYFFNGMMMAQQKNYEGAVEQLQKSAELAELYGDEPAMIKAKGMVSKIVSVMAAEAFNAKDYAKAASIFEKGYKANPTDTALGMNLAKSYCEMGDLEKGLTVYKEIVALESRNSKYAEAAAAAKKDAAYYIMLDAAKAAGEKNYDKAVADAESIIAFDPTNAQANMLLLQSFTNLKAYDKIIEVGDKAIAAQTTPALVSDAAFLVGAAYQNKENKAKAIELYRKVTVGPNVATAKAQITALSK